MFLHYQLTLAASTMDSDINTDTETLSRNTDGFYDTCNIHVVKLHRNSAIRGSYTNVR